MQNKTHEVIAIAGKTGSGKDLVGRILQYITRPLAWKSITFDEFNSGYGLAWHHPLHKYRIKKFADAVNDNYKRITGIDYSSLKGEEKDKYRVTFREYSEKTKMVFGPDIWAKTLFNEVNPVFKDPCPQCGASIRKQSPAACQESTCYKGQPDFRPEYHWIITDLRFRQTELVEVNKRKGIIIYIDRPLSLIYPEQWKAYVEATTLVAKPREVQEMRFISFLSFHKKESYQKLFQKLTHVSEVEFRATEAHIVIENNGTVEELIRKIESIKDQII